MTDLFHSLAGKYEYLAGMPRAEAEQRARDEIAEMEKKPEQIELFEKPEKEGVTDYFANMRKLFKNLDKEK